MDIKMKKIVFTLMMVCCLGMITPLYTNAEEAAQEAEIIELNQIMQTRETVEVKSEPKDNAEVIATYSAGVPVYVVGETVDGWYQISYQNQKGFVHKSELTEMKEVDVAALDEEMEAMEAEGKMVVEEVERYRAEVRRSRIWGTVIVLLVVGIFATGIISTVKAEKKKKDTDTEKLQENKEG